MQHLKQEGRIERAVSMKNNAVSMKNNDYDYYTVAAVRKAIAAQLAKAIEVTDELVAAKKMADDAAVRYRELVAEAADKAMERLG